MNGLNFVPTFESALVNAIVAYIMLDVLMAFMTMFSYRWSITSRIINWWLNRK